MYADRLETKIESATQFSAQGNDPGFVGVAIAVVLFGLSFKNTSEAYFLQF